MANKFYCVRVVSSNDVIVEIDDKEEKRDLTDAAIEYARDELDADAANNAEYTVNEIEKEDLEREIRHADKKSLIS